MTDFDERCDEGLALSDIIAKSNTPVALVEVITATDVYGREFGRTLVEEITVTGATVLKDAGLVKSESLTLDDGAGESELHAMTRTITETVIATGVVLKDITPIALTQTITLTGEGYKEPVKVCSETVTVDDGSGGSELHKVSKL